MPLSTTEGQTQNNGTGKNECESASATSSIDQVLSEYVQRNLHAFSSEDPGMAAVLAQSVLRANPPENGSELSLQQWRDFGLAAAMISAVGAQDREDPLIAVQMTMLHNHFAAALNRAAMPNQPIAAVHLDTRLALKLHKSYLAARESLLNGRIKAKRAHLRARNAATSPEVVANPAQRIDATGQDKRKPNGKCA